MYETEILLDTELYRIEFWMKNSPPTYDMSRPVIFLNVVEITLWQAQVGQNTKQVFGRIMVKNAELPEYNNYYYSFHGKLYMYCRRRIPKQN
jgi:hypothetical protein